MIQLSRERVLGGEGRGAAGFYLRPLDMLDPSSPSAQ